MSEPGRMDAWRERLKRRKQRPLRVLLVRSSPVGDALRGLWAAPVAAPLGVLYLTSALRESFGSSVEVETTSLSVELESLEELPAFVAQREPHVLGVSASLADEEEAAALVQAARRLSPPALTLIGGPYPTCSPERALRITGADLAVVGEAEHTLPHLLRCLMDGSHLDAVPGLATLSKEGEVERTSPTAVIDEVDALAFPAWDAIDLDAYDRLRNHNDWPPLRRPYAPMLTSRGCPFHCSYCHNVHGRRFRPRSPDSVIREAELLHERHGVRELHVVDDIFNFDGPRVEAICQGLIRRGLDLALAFPNGLRGDLLTREQLELLRAAGCYSIAVSLESASPRILQRMGRRVDLDRLAANVRLAAELGIMVSCFVMLGYPGETPEDLEKTFRWLRESWVDLPRHSVVAPFPGTQAAEHARARGLDPAVMEAGRGSYDWANAGLADMPPAEFHRRVRQGLDSILAVPRRQRRLRDLWQRWPKSDHRFMGYPPPSEPED